MFPRCVFLLVVAMSVANAIGGQNAGAGVINSELSTTCADEVDRPGWLAHSLKQLELKQQKTNEAIPGSIPVQLTFAELAAETDPAEAARRLEGLAAEYSRYPDFFRISGQIALADGRVSNARLNFQRAIKLVSESGWSDARKAKSRRQCELFLAAIAEQRSQWKYALTLLESAAGSGGEDNGKEVAISEAHRMRIARCRVFTGDYEGAFAQAEMASNGMPPYTAALRVAQLVKFTGRKSVATRWFQKACQSSTHAAPYISYARWAMRTGDFAKAGKQIRNAQDVEPKSADLLLAKVELNRYQSRFREAQDQLQDLIQQQPDNMQLRDALAMVMLSRHGKSNRFAGYQLAIENAKQLPDNATVMATLGRALHLHGHTVEAKKILTKAMSEERTSPDTAFYLAEVDARLGKTDQSISLLEMALQADGTFFSRSSAEQLLSQLKSKSSVAQLDKPVPQDVKQTVSMR